MPDPMSIPFDSWGPEKLMHAFNEGGLGSYAIMGLNCCFPTNREQVDHSREAMASIKHVMELGIDEVRRGVLAGDEQDMLELALRLYTGATVEKDENGAASLLDKILAILDTPRFVRVRALSLRAHIEFERRITQDNPDYWNIDALYRAAKYADEACALGFVSSGVLDIGITIERAGFRRQEDCRFPQWSTERFERLTDLWRVVDRRKAEIQRKESKRQGKLKKDPNAYICAARGCGVEATHKAGLQRCSGKCRKEGKPAYCSKECQKKDWKRHKQFCRDNALVDELAASMRQTVLEDDIKPINFADPTSYQPTMEIYSGKLGGGETVEPLSKWKKYEHRIDVADPRGGKDIKVISSSMDPAFMKEFKQTVNEELSERRP